MIAAAIIFTPQWSSVLTTEKTCSRFLAVDHSNDAVMNSALRTKKTAALTANSTYLQRPQWSSALRTEKTTGPGASRTQGMTPQWSSVLRTEKISGLGAVTVSRPVPQWSPVLRTEKTAWTGRPPRFCGTAAMELGLEDREDRSVEQYPMTCDDAAGCERCPLSVCPRRLEERSGHEIPPVTCCRAVIREVSGIRALALDHSGTGTREWPPGANELEAVIARHPKINNDY